jgi:hypothetical protein
MLVDKENLIKIPLEKHPNKLVKTDYFESLKAELKRYYKTSANYTTSGHIDVYVSIKDYSLSITEVKRKTRTRNLQKQRNPRNYYLLSKLGRMYNLSNSSRLLHFFDENHNLIPVVIEAHEELRKRFPSEELSLEVVSDPETDGCDELFAYILTSLPVEDALQKLNDLDEEWFLNQLERIVSIIIVVHSHTEKRV